MTKRIVTKSLRTVAMSILENSRFLRSLKKNPKEGLKKAGMRLSRKDLRKLKKLLQMRSLQKDLRIFKRIRRKYERALHIPPW